MLDWLIEIFWLWQFGDIILNWSLKPLELPAEISKNVENKIIFKDAGIEKIHLYFHLTTFKISKLLLFITTYTTLISDFQIKYNW